MTDRMTELLKAARPYIETCADDDLPNQAADLLKQIDDELSAKSE